MEKRPVDDAPVKPPSGRLGRYEIVKRLANGGMSDLLLARAGGSGSGSAGHHVVIKRLREGQAKDATLVATFVAQAQLAGKLRHHNIVQVQDVGEDDGKHYVAMEYVHGEDVRRILARLHERGQAMPVQHLITIGTSVAAALHHAHDQRDPDRKPLDLVHCDVTPGNILVGYDGNVKVVDFGIARAAIQALETQVGGRKGKAPYMAPEQCTGQGVDRRSDVFALGIVLYELATARRLFKGESEFLTMSTIVAGTLPPPSQHRKDLPEELEGIILKALSRAPADRYQTAAELRMALNIFAAKAKLSGSAAALADYMKQLFGGRPEPWLDHAEHPEVSTSDFDGATTGLAQAPAEAVEMFAIPDGATSDSPIAHAHAHDVTDKPTAILTMAKKPVSLKSFVQRPKSETSGKTPRPEPTGKALKPEANRRRPTPEPTGRALKPEADEQPPKPEAKGTSSRPALDDKPAAAKPGGAPPRAAGNRLPSSTQTPRSLPVVAPPVVAPPVVPPPLVAPPVLSNDARPVVDASAKTRLQTDLDETTSIAPPPPPAVVPSAAVRNAIHDATQIVAPLPFPLESQKRSSTTPALADGRPSDTDLTHPVGASRRKWVLAGLIGATAVVAVILVVVIGFSPPADRETTAATPPEAKPAEAKPPQPPPPPPEPPRPERTMRNSEPPPPPPDVTANAPAEPPPEKVPPPPAHVVTRSPAEATHSPARHSTEIAPPKRLSTPGGARKPTQVAKPAKPPARSPKPAKPGKPGKTPAYDPDALFLKKP